MIVWSMRLWFILAVLAVACVDSATEVFVSPDGDDAASGTIDAPLRSLHEAQRRTRAVAKGIAKTISLRSGVYFLGQMLAFSAEDEGTTVRTYPPDLTRTGRAVLSGGMAVPAGSFRAVGAVASSSTASGNATPPIFRATLPSGTAPFTQLYVGGGGRGRGGGTRRTRARHPNVSPDSDPLTRGLADDSTLQYASPLAPCAGSAWNPTCPDEDRWGFVFNGSDLSGAWRNPPDNPIEVLVFHAWTAFWSPVAAIHDANRSVVFAEAASKAVGAMAVQGGRRYLVENVFEALDSPGEFYFDRSTGTLSYVPTAAEIAAGAENLTAIVPVLKTILQVDASGAELGLRFVDLAVQHASEGYRINVYESSFSAVVVQRAADVSFERCDITRVGANGMRLGDGVRGVSITDSRVALTGADGVQITGLDAADVTVRNTIVRDTALTILGQPASLRLRGAQNITVEHCDVSRNPYGGIMAGWMPQALPTPQPADAHVFTVAYNRVYEYGMGILSDFAGVYISSGNNLCFEARFNNTCSVPTLVRQNVISASSSYNYGGAGVYMDEQVSSVRIERNLIHDVADRGVYFHCGTNNTADNNVVAYASQQHGTHGYIGSCNAGGNPTWPNISHGFTYTRNIHFISSRAAPNGTAADQLTTDNDYRDTHFDRNVYYSPDPGAPRVLRFPNGTTFAEWQAQGQDVHSLVGDPGLVDPASGNYSLAPGAAARAMGIEEIDTISPGIDASANPFSIAEV